jgi:hypothetical protein
LCRISTREAHLEPLGQSEQAFDEPVNPGLAQVLRQGKRQECGDGRASHGSDVAQAAGEAAMPNDFGEVPLAPEMNPFQAEIGSNQGLVTGGYLQYGTIIPDACRNPFSASRATSDARNEQFFGERHGGSIIYKRGGSGASKYGTNSDIAAGQPLPTPIHLTNHCDW